jgi:hypothetical protein
MDPAKKLLEAAKDVLRLLDNSPGAPKDHWMVTRLRDAVKVAEG